MLPPDEQLNYDIWQRLIDNELRELELGGYRLPLSKVWGFHLAFPDCYLTMPFDTVEDYEKYIARLNAFPQYVQDQIELMREALRRSFIPPRATLEGVDEAMRAQLVSDPADSVLYQPFLSFPAALGEAQRARLKPGGAGCHPGGRDAWLPGGVDLPAGRIPASGTRDHRRG